jgi:hypothetical protein
MTLTRPARVMGDRSRASRFELTAGLTKLPYGDAVLAMVLFFCGIMQQFQYFRARLVLTRTGDPVGVYDLSRVLVLPRA